MTTYEFELAAKNAILEHMRTNHGLDYELADVQVVWMAHVLGFKKAIMIISGDKFAVMFEVTYNREKNEMYLDEYFKNSNTVILPGKFRMSE